MLHNSGVSVDLVHCAYDGQSVKHVETGLRCHMHHCMPSYGLPYDNWEIMIVFPNRSHHLGLGMPQDGFDTTTCLLI